MSEDKPDLKVVAAALDRPDPVAGPEPPDPPKGGTPRREPGEIFPGSPVTPLGMMGKYAVFLDCLQQLQDVDALTHNAISQMYGGRTDVLTKHFAKRNKDGIIVGWDQPRVRDRMFEACAEKGIWKSHEKLRGIGAWPDGEGGVLLHCGDRLLRQDRDGKEAELRPGEIDGYVYPADAPGPRPAPRGDGDGRAAAAELLEVLKTWRWVRGETDAHLLFGWIVGAMFCGALDWRPMVWLTGGKGTGKSTLQKLISDVMGGEAGLLTASDASEAGIRSVIQRSTLPVALDEAEASDDNRKMQGVVKLARQAASGGLVLRGSADHKGAEFRVRSAFLFGSILIPPLMDQDLSRIGVLELVNFELGTVPPKLSRTRFRRIGRLIRRSVWDHWDALHETLEGYRSHLAASGHTSRSADQYGTLLTMADLALYGHPPDGEVMAGWATKLSAEAFRAQTDESDGWQDMLTHLLSQPFDAYRSGKRFTVGEVIAAACDLPGKIAAFEPAEAQENLRRCGIAIEGKGASAKVVLANKHQGIEQFFRDTRWAAGVHRQDAKRIPGAETPKSARSLARASTRVTIFPLSVIPWFISDNAENRAPHPEPIPF